MEQAQNVVLTPLTIGMIVGIVGVLALSFGRATAWLKTQVADGKAEMAKDVADLKADNILLRAKIDKMQSEVDALQDGKAKCLQCLGRALGANDLTAARVLIDAAITAIAPNH